MSVPMHMNSAYLSRRMEDNGAVTKSNGSAVGAHSTRDALGWCRNVQEAPVYRPTVEEFEDPVAFIRSIKDEAERFGICKIIPPVQASTPCFDALRRDVGHSGAIGSLKLTTRQQLIGNLEWEDWDQNRFWTAPERNLKGFHQQAENTAAKVFGTCLQMPVRKVEESFWTRMTKPCKASSTDFYVEYGDNIEGTGFSDDTSDPLGSSAWNLNKLPFSDQNSPIKLLQTPIPGVTTPMLYHGTLFSTFSWHIEDLYLNSINYHHVGACKTWYAVGAQHADAFEQVVQEEVYHKMCAKMRKSGASEQDIKRMSLKTLFLKNTIFSPGLLVARGIPVTRIEQAAGEYVITFPRSYHAGFSHGINLGEAVNFAMTEWYEFGCDAGLRMAFLGKPPALPMDQITCIDACTLSDTLKASADMAQGADVGFRQWLLDSGASAVPSHTIPLIVSFCRIIRWHHRHMSSLLLDGMAMDRQAIDVSVPCSATSELMHVVAIMPADTHEPVSLRHWLAGGRDNGGPGGRKGTITLHEKWEVYYDLAQIFCELCLQQGWGAVQPDEWRAQGLTDRLTMPHSKVSPCWEDLTQPYDWGGGVSSPLHSALSSSDCLPRACGKDGSILPPLATLLPEPAADVPLVAPPKKVPVGLSSKRSSSKGSRGSRKAVGRMNAKDPQPQESVPAGTPKVELSEATGVPEQAQSPSTAGKSPQGVPPAGVSPVDGGGDEQPRKRASRASKNAAMASWKANRMLEEDGEDEGSMEDDRPGRRSSKKVKREDSASVPPSAKAGPALAKVYSNATAALSNVLGEDVGGSGKDPSSLLNCFNNNGAAVGQWSSGGGPNSGGGPLGVGDLGLPTGGSQQNLPMPSIPRSGTLPGSQGDVSGGHGAVGGSWGGPTGTGSGGPVGLGPNVGGPPGGGSGSDAPVRPQSVPLNPFTNYPAFQQEQELWRRRVGEINNQWVQKLQEGAKTNAEVQALLRYYMSLPDVSQVYPVNADSRMGGPMASTGSGGAPSPGLGGNNGHGSANLPTGSGMQGSGQLNGGAPMGMQQGANSQRRPLTGQGLGPWNAAPARKESLHNGPISAQDLATGIRGRPATSEDSRQNGGQNRVQTTSGVQQGVGGTSGPGAAPSGPTSAAGVAAAAAAAAAGPVSMPSTRSRSTRAAAGAAAAQPRTSASNMQGGPDPPGASMQPDATGGASPHNMSPTMPMQGGGLGPNSMPLGVMDLPSPNAPLSPHSPVSPHSVSEFIGRDREFHDFMSFLGGEADGDDLGMEFNIT